MTADQSLTTFLKPDDTKIVEVPLERIVFDTNQPKKFRDPDYLRSLGESMLSHGQIQPILLTPEVKVVVGEGRVRAGLLVGMTTIKAIVVNDTQDATKKLTMQGMENLMRSDMTDYEKYLFAIDLLKLNATWSKKDLAAHLKISPATITRWTAAEQTTPAWQAAYRDGKVTQAEIYIASQLPLDQQDVMLEQKRNGAKVREEVRKIRRAKGSSGKPTVKTSRIAIALSARAKIVVFGDQMDLDALIEHLSAGQALAKSAKKQGLCIRTSEPYWEDLSKARA